MNYHQLMFRPGTWDADIWKTVTQEDEYGLGEYRFDRTKNAAVIDVGAHVGAFTFNVLSRGAVRVVAVEPDEDNLFYLRHNVYMALGAVDRVVVVAGAVSGRLNLTVDFPPLAHPNTGGRAVTNHAGLEVDEHLRAAVYFPVLVDLAVPGGDVNLAKLDCEGSEWDILDGLALHDPQGAAARVQNWVGEYHCASPAANGKKAADLVALFKKIGCTAETKDTGEGIGLFRAWRANGPGYLKYRAK